MESHTQMMIMTQSHETEQASPLTLKPPFGNPHYLTLTLDDE